MEQGKAAGGEDVFPEVTAEASGHYSHLGSGGVRLWALLSP